MDIKQVIECRAELKKNIEQSVCKFVDKTGCIVSQIKIVEINPYGVMRDGKLVMITEANISVDVRLPEAIESM